MGNVEIRLSDEFWEWLDKKFAKKKELKPQLTVVEERLKLKKEMADWEIKKAEILEDINKHYKENPDGGIYYRWFDDDCYHQTQMFGERAYKLLLREEQERQKDNEKVRAKLLEKAKKKEPRVVKARLDAYTEQTKE